MMAVVGRPRACRNQYQSWPGSDQSTLGQEYRRSIDRFFDLPPIASLHMMLVTIVTAALCGKIHVRSRQRAVAMTCDGLVA